MIIKAIVLLAKRISGESGAGRRGELRVRWKLKFLPKEYFVINDLMIDRGNGYTSQIDHVVVSPYGIFVIETKNISGHIYGSERAQTWKRYWKAWYYGVEHSDELEFDNPILQNEAHIRALSIKLGGNLKYIPIIVFSNNAVLQVTTQDTYVTYATYVRRLIRRYREPIMSVEQAQEIYNRILALNITDENIRERHAVRAQINKNNYKQRQEDNRRNGACPQCGGRLVIRQGKYGSFYGCSNYPNCKYTHPINA